MNYALRMRSIFCLCFRFLDLIVLKIWSSQNQFIEKILDIFAVWIDFTFTRFNWLALTLQQRVASFYAESNGIFGKFVRRLLKICIQIKSICQTIRDSLASLVHNNLIRSLVTTTGCVFVWSNMVFLEIFYDHY